MTSVEEMTVTADLYADCPKAVFRGYQTEVIARHGDNPISSFTPYNHYAMLATIENSWNLGCLANTCDTANVQPMADLLSPSTQAPTSEGSSFGTRPRLEPFPSPLCRLSNRRRHAAGEHHADRHGLRLEPNLRLHAGYAA
jgi:hypothetical protein